MMTPSDIQSRVIFRDQLVLILDKPPGIPVHAGPSGGENLEDYFEYLKFGYKETPKLAHRLDRDTSGCLVLGRNDRALKKLGRLFEQGLVKKKYLAVTQNRPAQDSGTIDLPLIKVKLQKGWSMQPAHRGQEGAQEAVTDYTVLKTTDDGRTLIELSPRTGRTHQIRVHLQSMNCPIIGDWLYGPDKTRPETFERLLLHALEIEIPLHENQPALKVRATPAPEGPFS